ncbi:hypothetical protein ACFL5E_03040 [Candidatus Omnitrophota bacterium]
MISILLRTATVLSVLVLCLFQQGCIEDNGEAEKKIIAHDPAFQKTLDNRDSLRRQIDTLKTTHIQKSDQIDGQISALREQKTQMKKDYSASIDKIKRQIQPGKRDIQRSLTDLQRDYSRKKIEIKDIQKDINEITDLINKKEELALTQEEIRTWNDRLASLVEKKEKLTSEKDKLREEIGITKLKDKVMRL